MERSRRALAKKTSVLFSSPACRRLGHHSVASQILGARPQCGKPKKGGLAVNCDETKGSIGIENSKLDLDLL